MNEMTEEQPLDKAPIDFTENRFLSSHVSPSGNNNDSKIKEFTFSFKREIYSGQQFLLTTNVNKLS